MTSLEIAQEALLALDSKKAEELRLLEIREISSLADYFVIATAGSTTQAKALADEVEFRLSQAGVQPGHLEGHAGNMWILMDYGSVIVHVFLSRAREFYDLERLWKDAKQLPLEDILPC